MADVKCKTCQDTGWATYNVDMRIVQSGDNSRECPDCTREALLARIAALEHECREHQGVAIACEQRAEQAEGQRATALKTAAQNIYEREQAEGQVTTVKEHEQVWMTQRQELREQIDKLKGLLNNEECDSTFWKEQAEQAERQVQIVQDERAASFAMLSRAVGRVGLTEYQAEVDLEIESRIRAIIHERETVKSHVAALREALEAVLTDDNSKRCVTDLTMSGAIIEGVKAVLMDTAAAAEAHTARIFAEGRVHGLEQAANWCKKHDALNMYGASIADHIRGLKEAPGG